MALPKQFVFIIGAPKSGTTSLAHWLNLRPDMAYCAGKEPRFFTDFGDIDWTGPGSDLFKEQMYTDEASYLAGFPDDPAVTWAIDGSTDYLWNPAALGRLQDWSKRFPCKFICMLRDPVDRALSEYQHTRRDNMEDKSFLQSLEAEEARFAAHWQPLFYHRRRSLYHAAVTSYAQAFGDDFLLLDYAALRDPDACLRQVEAFLQVGPGQTASEERQNASYIYRNQTLGAVMNHPGLRRVVRSLVPAGLRGNLRKQVVGRFADRYEPSEQDRRAMAELIAEDIALCRADPLFPTDTWTA